VLLLSPHVSPHRLGWIACARGAVAPAVAGLVVVLLVTLAGSPVLAWHHGGAHVVIGVGPYWWGPPYPYWWYAPYPVYAPPPPPVIVEQPPVYVQRPAVPEAPEGPYWYYCASARGYYPDVAQCSEPWIKVPPRPPQ
jgi:hypothetical protein